MLQDRILRGWQPQPRFTGPPGGELSSAHLERNPPDVKFLVVVVSAIAIAAAVAGGVALYMSDKSSDSRAEWSNGATHMSVVPSRYALVKDEGPGSVLDEDASSRQAPVTALASADGSIVSRAWFPVH
jgi:hypothetical protein